MSIIIGNWKMYKTRHQAVEFIKALLPLIQNCPNEVWLSVPFTSLQVCVEEAKGKGVKIGAQNMNEASEGAFTGEIAGQMLKEGGAEFVLLGHSERRKIFHETDEMIAAKVGKALEVGITPVLCVGETEEEREGGEEKEVLQRQIFQGFQKAPKDAYVILAYEPVWAIGTGKMATPKLAAEAHVFCRKILTSHFGKNGKSIPILYGGSVKPDTIQALLKENDINGALVGGASLDPKSFAAIANAR